MAAAACVAPTSTPATTRAPGLSASSAGGRPPVERAAAERRHQPQAHAARRCGRRWSSAPGRWRRRARRASSGRPSRSSSKMSPACTASSEAPHGFRTSRHRLLRASRQKCVTRATVRPCRPPTSRCSPPVRGVTKSFLGNTVLARRRPRAARRPGARPRRRERRGQVDADEDPGRRATSADAGTVELDGERGVLRPPGPGAARRARRRCSRSSTCCRSARRRERLPRPRAAHAAASSTPRGMDARHRRACSTGLGVTDLTTTAAGAARSRSPSSRSSRSPRRVSFDAKVISMDEPTAALADHEVELLYAIIRRLTARGVAILYVSPPAQGDLRPLRHHHRPQGRRAQVSSGPAAELDDGRARAPHGRPLDRVVLPRPARRAPTVGELAARAARRAATATSTASTSTLRAGEIVGVAGLQGSGRTELVEAIFGVDAVHPRHDARSTARPCASRSAARRPSAPASR